MTRYPINLASGDVTVTSSTFNVSGNAFFAGDVDIGGTVISPDSDYAENFRSEEMHLVILLVLIKKMVWLNVTLKVTL